MKNIYTSLIFFLLIMQTNAQQALFQSKDFSIYHDKVIQDKNEAKILSPVHIISNYQSPANLYQSADISFKFAINGKDNEMLSGQDHHFSVKVINGKSVTPVIKFGEQLKEPATGEYLQPNTSLTIRLDMRDVVKHFNEKGYFTTFKGDKIYKEDFKGVFVAGGTAPMFWDFDNLVNRSELRLTDEDGDGIFETTMILNKQSDQKQTDAEWKMVKDATAFPQYQSSYLISDALYNMSIEEMIKAVELDSTFRTGKEWAGVWTRDISYSIILSMAHLQPEVAKKSLLRKVNKKKRIIQDTGTGGAYPASTDRMIWAVAANEVYKATGDKDWLQLAYTIIKNSIEDDMHNVYDAETGMVKGESSFLDWREQTYPKWMQPADIFESECLGTNAVHYQANIVLSEMASILKQTSVAVKHTVIAKKIKDGINKYLWLPDKGYYGQFLYGRNFKMVSPRSEALGEALCIVFGIADDKKAKQIVASTPLTAFGINCIYPNIPNIPPYHNNAVWPFVQTYWLWAAAKVGNEAAVNESIFDIYRPAALFLTNKENFVAENGDFAGTVINSSNMLWSLSGNISLVHKVLFGIKFQSENLLFQPYVPKVFDGKRSLTNFKYRNAVLNIEMEGYGNGINSFLVDGKENTKHEIPGNLKGIHSIKIILNNQQGIGNKINKVTNHFTLPAPNAALNGNELSWSPVSGAKKYHISKNGKWLSQTSDTKFSITDKNYGEYTVVAVDEYGVESFACEPVVSIEDAAVKTYDAEKYATKAIHNYKGFTGYGFIEINTTENRNVTIPVNVTEDGLYAIDFRYANGNGPTNTENKCAIRTLKVDDMQKGTLVFPQRGKGEWSNWGYSNAVKLFLKKGDHKVTLSFEDANDNMNGDINQAMLDNMRLIKIK
ncbi:MAG: glycogen debranching protein [Sphingobacteriales bacterium]|nr:glycogen debranching protein [Sphingobacteriales bacterium]